MSRINEILEEFTSDILLNNDMYTIPVDLIMLANNNEIKVFEAELANNISGAIRFNNEVKKFEILVNSKDTRVRQRFTIAHELGHFFLHRDILESEDIHIDILYRTEKTPEEVKREKEVDYFAGALLMNRTLLKKLRNNYSITELAEMFEVSASAMTVRLDILGIL